MLPLPLYGTLGIFCLPIATLAQASVECISLDRFPLQILQLEAIVHFVNTFSQLCNDHAGGTHRMESPSFTLARPPRVDTRLAKFSQGSVVVLTALAFLFFQPV